LGRRYSSHQVGRVLTISASKPDTMIFWGNAQSCANRYKGFHPLRCGSPLCDKPPRTGTPSSSLCAGAVWGDRLKSPPSSYLHPEFHSRGKGILQSLFFDRWIFGPYEDHRVYRIRRSRTAAVVGPKAKAPGSVINAFFDTS
jgi:hypothetical protein